MPSMSSSPDGSNFTRARRKEREQTLYLLGPGDPFGMCTAFAIDSFPVNAMALEESGILLIPGQIMETIAMKEPRLLLNIIQVLSDRLKESMTLIESLSLKEIPAAARLLPAPCPDQGWRTGNEPPGIDDHPAGAGQDPGSHPGSPLAGDKKDEQCREYWPWTADRSGFWTGRRLTNWPKGTDEEEETVTGCLGEKASWGRSR